MCLAFGARDATQDVDALFEPSSRVLDAARGRLDVRSDARVFLEANPEDVTPERAAACTRRWSRSAVAAESSWRAIAASKWSSAAA